MIRAGIAGATTAAGMFLGIWAVFQNVRLDWPETALVAGVAFFAVGAVLLWQMVEEMTKEG